MVRNAQGVTTMAVNLTPKTISQKKLARYLELEAQVKEFDDLKKEIIGLIRDGLPCQAGRFSCRLKEVESTSVPWKQYYVSVAGEEAAAHALAENKGNTIRRSLVVVDRENPV